VSAIEPPFDLVTYEMADGSLIYDEYSHVTGLEFFEDRDEAVVLTRKRYRLIDAETITLPDPYPIEDDDAD
jgi:hypothetical protein